MTVNQLRERIAADNLLVVPGVFDALTATITEEIGFDALYLGGFSTGASLAATEPMTTMTEMCDRAREIVNVTDRPLIVDGGAGWGNPPHTHRTVREFINTGISAIHLEDQVYPKRLHYHAGMKHLVDVEEMESRIEMAVEAREEHDDDIVIIARSDAGTGQRKDEGETIEDAVERVNSYLDAGADVGWVFPRTPEDVQYAAEHVNGPQMFFSSEFRDNPTTDELSDLGYSMAIYGLTSSMATAKVVRDAYRTLFEDGESPLDKAESDELYDYINDVIELPKYYELEERSGYK